MTQEELNKVLEAHKHYLAQDCEGWQKMSADLSDADAVLFVRRHSYGCTLLFDTGAVILPRPVPSNSLKQFHAP